MSSREEILDTCRCEKTRLEKIIEYVEKNIDGDLALPALSEVFAMTPNSLSRFFHQATGNNLHPWIVKKRVELAKDLLLETNLTIDKVAERSGFNSTATCRRQFTRHTGVSPREFRKSCTLRYIEKKIDVNG